MKLRLLALLILASASSISSAQEGALDTKEPAPVPPLVGKAPDICGWKINYFYIGGVVRPGTPSTASLREITVYKAGDHRRELIPSGKGGREENFYTHGSKFYQLPGFNPNDVYMQPVPGAESIDFPELTWISLDYYVGVKREQGRKYYVFAKLLPAIPKVASPAPTSGEKKPMLEVWIDAETRLPFKIQDPKYRRSYEFFKSTPADAEPSPGIRKRVQAMSGT